MEEIATICKDEEKDIKTDIAFPSCSPEKDEMQDTR
jgi:hypothetical protein